MDRSKIIGFAVWLGLCALVFVLPASVVGSVRDIGALGIAVFLAISALGGLAWSTWVDYRRRQRARRNPLDPSLRSLVGSDLSWDNCAQAPDFAADALSAFRFLVEREGFSPARMDPEYCLLTFRRGDVAVEVGLGPYEQGLEATAVVVLLRAPGAMSAVEADAYGSMTHGLGDGFRGLAFHIQAHLDRIVDDLRAVYAQGRSAHAEEETASAPPEDDRTADPREALDARQSLRPGHPRLGS